MLTLRGTLALHHGVSSNHSIVWADYDPKKLFCGETEDRCGAHGRQLTLGNVEAVKTYIKILTEQLKQANVYDWLEKLEQFLDRYGPMRETL